jgi:hypothetical protein
MLPLSLLTLAVLQGVVVRSLSFFGPDFRYFDGAIQYCDLGGPLVTRVNVVFSMWEFQGNKRAVSGTSVINAGAGVAVFLMTRVEKGFPLALKKQREVAKGAAMLRREPAIVAGATDLRPVQ